MKKLLIILFITIACLIIAGKVCDRAYKKFWWPFFDKLDVAIKDSTYYDGIYLGDSRVHFGINPYYIDSIASVKSYNLGMGGAPVKEIYFLAAHYLQQHAAPKFAVISIGYANLLQPSRSFENPCYYFFYTGDTATNSALQNLHYHTTLYKILPVLKYTAFDDFNKFSIPENLKGKTIVKPGGITYNGFINNNVSGFNMAEQEKSAQHDTAYSAGISTLEVMIQLFIKNNTIPVLLYPPGLAIENSRKAPAELKIDSALSLLANKYQLKLLHYDTDTAFTKDLFTDPWHLNIKGTVLYSKKIGAAVKTILQ